MESVPVQKKEREIFSSMNEVVRLLLCHAFLFRKLFTQCIYWRDIVPSFSMMIKVCCVESRRYQCSVEK